MNKSSIVIIIVTILCFSFLSFNKSTASVNAETKKDAGYITLSTSKTKEVEPNLARVTFAVENTGSTAQKATNDNNEVSNKIISALKLITKEGVDTIKTNNFSLRPVYSSSSSGKREIKSYMAVNSVIVETKDTSKVSKLIDTAISNGANRTEGLYYSYENEKSVCSEAYPEMLKELRTQADGLAKAAGTVVDGVRNISVSCNMNMVSNGRFFYSNSLKTTDAAVGESNSSVPVEAGKVKVNVYVNADFYVK